MTSAALYASIIALVEFKFHVVHSAVPFPAPVELVPFVLGNEPKDGVVPLAPAAARPGSTEVVLLAAGAVVFPAEADP